ncbi:MAG: FAD-dependent oxidoreductase, partial [Erysipelotrichaceae bacterium]
MYDVVIIGAGPAGYVAAIKAAQRKLRVAVVESNKVGGTCLHHGCIPTKALLQEGQKYQQLLKQLQAYDLLGVDFPSARVYEQKNALQNQLEKGILGLLRANQVDLIQGVADIVEGRVWVNGEVLETK